MHNRKNHFPKKPNLKAENLGFKNVSTKHANAKFSAQLL